MRNPMFTLFLSCGCILAAAASAAPVPATNDPQIDTWMGLLSDDLAQYQKAPESLFTPPASPVEAPCAQSPDALKQALRINVPGSHLSPEEVENQKSVNKVLHDKGIAPKDTVISDVAPRFITATCGPTGLEGPFVAYASYTSGSPGDPKPNRFIEHIEGTMRAGHFVGQLKIVQRMYTAYFPEPFTSFSYADATQKERPLPNATLTYSAVGGTPSIMTSFSKSLGGDRWFTETYQNGVLFSHTDMKGAYFHGRNVTKTQVECYDTGEKIMDPECAVK